MLGFAVINNFLVLIVEALSQRLYFDGSKLRAMTDHVLDSP